MFMLLQKSDTPFVDNLPIPPFESELKRASTLKTTPISKQVPISEVGTSVVPRQRPKGNASTQNLPLVLPSSPSPRNIISSPSPQVLQTDPNSDNSDKSLILSDNSMVTSVSQTQTPVSPFNLSGNQMTKQSKNNLLTTNVSQVDATTPIKSNVVERLENLFEARFSETFPESTNVIGNSVGGIVDAKTAGNIKTPESPIVSPMQLLLTAPKPIFSGHRRNMSDTTAFNK